MLTKTSNLFNAISEKLLKVADVFLWVFVAVGIIKIIYNGVSDACDYALGVCILFSSISILCSAIAFVCRLLKGDKNGSK